jgi:O-antigen/teichoic acid export membrane protein
VTTPIVAQMRAALRQGRADPLVRNSLYLMLTTATMAAVGFVFWLINARLYTPDQVGQATALITAVTVLSYVSLAGMNTTVIRHLAGVPDPGDVVSSAVGTVGLAAVGFAVGYVLLLPVLAPDLAHLVRHPGLAALFVILTVGSSVNLLTDSIFVARRAAGWNFALDGLLLGVVKLALPFALVGLGVFGIFAASAAASTVAALVSLTVCHHVMHMRLRPTLNSALLRETWSYSAANYVASWLNLLPIMAMPLALLRGADAVLTAGFFAAFQIATIVNSIPYAVCEAMFAEGSLEGNHLRHTARRAAGLIVGLTVAAVLVVLLVGDFVLGLFGPTYRATAGSALSVLALGALGVSVYSWGNSLLKITGQLLEIVVVNAVYATVIIALAVIWAPRGPVWVSWAWVIGNVSAGIVAVAAVAWRRR